MDLYPTDPASTPYASPFLYSPSDTDTSWYHARGIKIPVFADSLCVRQAFTEGSLYRSMESVAETLADGLVDESELRTTIPKLEAVIQECAPLRNCWKTSVKRGKRKQEITSEKTIVGFCSPRFRSKLPRRHAHGAGQESVSGEITVDLLQARFWTESYVLKHHAHSGTSLEVKPKILAFLAGS